VSNQRIAVVPGSFDPMTNGHIAIVKRAAELYDIVYVAVMINDKKQYMFSLEQREEIAKACLDSLDNKKIRVISSRDWLWHLCSELNACAIVKGYRNDVDLKYENEMAEFNRSHYPKAETVLLKADDSMTDLSSTLIRDKILNSEDFSNFMPQKAVEIIKKIKPKN
jgi:pantetheine-phosphate adenylyltransferase